MAERDGIEVRYSVPFGEDGEGYVDLRVTVPVVCGTADRAFVLEVMAAVTRFAQVAVPGAGPDPQRLDGLVRSWDTEAAHLRAMLDSGQITEAVAQAAAGARARELEGVSVDVRRVLADARGLQESQP